MQGLQSAGGQCRNGIRAKLKYAEPRLQNASPESSAECACCRYFALAPWGLAPQPICARLECSLDRLPGSRMSTGRGRGTGRAGAGAGAGNRTQAAQSGKGTEPSAPPRVQVFRRRIPRPLIDAGQRYGRSMVDERNCPSIRYAYCTVGTAGPVFSGLSMIENSGIRIGVLPNPEEYP